MSKDSTDRPALAPTIPEVVRIVEQLIYADEAEGGTVTALSLDLIKAILEQCVVHGHVVLSDQLREFRHASGYV